jgi:cation transporter-like permease
MQETRIRMSKGGNAVQNVLLLVKASLIGVGGLLLVMFGPHTNMFLTAGVGAIALLICVLIFAYTIAYWNDDVKPKK